MSPSTIADGYPGKEVAHIVDGALRLGDRHMRPAYIRINKITNFHGLAEADDKRAPRVGRAGEILYPSERRGKTIVYDAEVRGKTLQDMRQMGSLARSILRGRSDEHSVDLADPTVPWRFYGRTIDFNMDEDQINGPEYVWPWTRKFSWTVRMSDPRVYVWNGGANSGTQADGAALTVFNAGNTDTDPVFLLNPTTAQIVIRNLSIPTPLDAAGLSTVQLQLNNVNPGNGQIVFDFKKRTIQQGATDISGLLNTARSNWWDENVPGLLAGNNGLTAAGGAWSASWYHASE